MDTIPQVLSRLPGPLADSIRSAAALSGGQLREIRLYREQCPIVVAGDHTSRGGVICTGAAFDGFLLDACGHALYAHSDTIREGYIHTSYGARIGVCGRAVLENGRVARVTDIASLCIRISARHPGAADGLIPHILSGSMPASLLLVSPPGVGKTTVLRELAIRFAYREVPLRCAVVDTREEIAWGVEMPGVDILSGYPRGEGMEIALRTLSPQLLLCDEISREADARAVLSAVTGGVAVIATAHGGSMAQLRQNPVLSPLLRGGVFSKVAFLSRRGGQLRMDIQPVEANL